MTAVLVTGATGTVGSAVADRLRASDIDVRVASRSPVEARNRFGNGIDVVDFDLARPETWGSTLDGIDRLFLLRPPNVGTEAITDFVDAAARTGVEHVVYLSVLGAEKVPFIPHRRIERHLEGVAVTHTFLRAAYFMQNLSEIHRPEIVERDEIFVPAGDGSLGFVDARDIGAVGAMALAEAGHENRAYDLTGSVALDFHEVAAILSEVLDRQISYRDPSIPTFVRRMSERGLPLGLVAFMVLEYTVTRFDVGSRTTSEIDRLLGREPRTMREFAVDYRDQFEPTTPGGAES